MGDAQPVPHLSNQTQALAASVFVVAVDFSAEYFPGARTEALMFGAAVPTPSASLRPGSFRALCEKSGDCG